MGVRAGQVKSAIEQALRLPAGEAEYPYRRIQESGNITTGKRGKGGADLSTRDAMQALLGVIGVNFRGDAVTFVNAYADLRMAYVASECFERESNGAVTHEGGPWQIGAPALQRLKPRCSFADALTALIESERDFEFEDAARAINPGAKFVGHNITVDFFGPHPKAGIEIRLQAGKKSYIEQAVFLPNKRDLSAEASRAEQAFQITVTIDHQVIGALAKLFREVA